MPTDFAESQKLIICFVAGEPMLWEQHDFAPQECGMPCSPGTYDAGQCIFADISNCEWL